MNNEPADNESFSSDCNLPPCPEAWRIAAAVRATIAGLGKVDSGSIRAASTFESLGALPFWSNCGDVGFQTDVLASELQRMLGVTFSKSQLEKIRDPDLNVRMTVAEFVRDVWTAKG